MRRTIELLIDKTKAALIALSIFAAIFYSPHLQAANFNKTESPFKLDRGNYIVAGVFQYFENAVKYSDYLFAHGVPSKYGYYPATGWYYVFTAYYGDLRAAKSECMQYKKHWLLKKAWVLTIEGGADWRNQTAPEQAAFPATTAPMEIEMQEVTAEKPEHDAPAIIPEAFEAEQELKLFLRTYDIRTHAEVDAIIDIVDPVKLRPLAQADANGLFVFKRPEGINSLLAISGRFGYRKADRLLDLNNITGSSPNMSVSGDTVFLDFELTRLKTGDIVTMYNVYFFNNSAIMKPESRYEVNQLLDMLVENENYRIVIHGHTNGNGYGPIIRMNSDDINFFALSKNNKEAKGSAKQLSLERAAAIQRYLVHQGIDKKRMKVKGWGGKKMLYTANDSNAKQNVRVEVEIKSE